KTIGLVYWANPENELLRPSGDAAYDDDWNNERQCELPCGVGQQRRLAVDVRIQIAISTTKANRILTDESLELRMVVARKYFRPVGSFSRPVWSKVFDRGTVSTEYTALSTTTGSVGCVVRTRRSVSIAVHPPHADA